MKRVSDGARIDCDLHGFAKTVAFVLPAERRAIAIRIDDSGKGVRAGMVNGIQTREHR